jgi:medium-chain acyl-[acyl-carrier-protein] hydrolase
MPPEIDFCPIELPGRAARICERPLTSIAALMDRLYDVLQPLMRVPFGFFGHSIGAWLAYEAASQLRAIDGGTAVHLFVSGRNSPRRASSDSPQALPPLSDDDLLSILQRFGGTPAAVMQRSELMTALLPALRADLALVDGYTVDSRYRIGCKITAFGGVDDVSHCASLGSWEDFTSVKFRSCMFPGGHFYFSSVAAALAREIIEDLRTSLSMHAANTKWQT